MTFSKLFNYTILTSVLLCGSIFGQTVKMPEKVEVSIGRMAKIKVESDGDETKYFSSEGLDVFREYSTDPKDIRLVVIGYEHKTYEVYAYTCKANKLSDPVKCLVVVGTPKPPVPPGPDPNPGPGPNPDPSNKFDLEAKVIEWKNLVTVSGLGGAGILSDNFATQAQVFKKGQTTKEFLENTLKQTAEKNKKSLEQAFINPGEWEKWGIKLQEYLIELRTSKKIVTHEDFAQAFIEISKGLKKY